MSSEEKLHENWICRREKRQWSMSKASPRKVKDLEEVDTKKRWEHTVDNASGQHENSTIFLCTSYIPRIVHVRILDKHGDV